MADQAWLYTFFGPLFFLLFLILNFLIFYFLFFYFFFIFYFYFLFFLLSTVIKFFCNLIFLLIYYCCRSAVNQGLEKTALTSPAEESSNEGDPLIKGA